MDILQVKTVQKELIESLLSEEAKTVYNNEINSCAETVLRYLKVSFEEKEKEEKLKWLINRFNSLAKYFRGAYGPVAELPLHDGRGIFFIGLVLKNEHQDLTKEQLNEK